ncbi:hypothetical protein RvY_08334 [Ramazzottius varieornatus]|uniref:Uncharacterized protein n=1 Tax=Ramazzottius varieornatus TaxID=947166 RepID=A0A1D1V5J9_RAMVA|nr:hypothetical protein RvY_08334 [Ramazzottius varieornatus]
MTQPGTNPSDWLHHDIVLWLTFCLTTHRHLKVLQPDKATVTRVLPPLRPLLPFPVAQCVLATDAATPTIFCPLARDGCYPGILFHSNSHSSLATHIRIVAMATKRHRLALQRVVVAKERDSVSHKLLSDGRTLRSLFLEHRAAFHNTGVDPDPGQ